MKRYPSTSPLGAIFAIAALTLVAGPEPLLAKQPGNRPPCTVGTVAYPSIQSAVQDPDCRTIKVPAGTFYESVNIISRDVSIRGEGPDKTIVNGSWNSAPVFNLNTTMPFSGVNNQITLEGMTITGGTGPAAGNNRNGGGVSSARTDLTVKDCIITGNSAWGNGGGLSFVYGTTTIMDSVITNNLAKAYPDRPGVVSGGGGLRGSGSPNALIVKDSVISGNVSWKQGGGILSVSTTTPGVLTIKDSIVTDNTAAAQNGGGGIYLDYTALKLEDSTVSANAPDDIYQVPHP